MTAGQSSEVDFDLLADYLGGALTGTPDEAAVARLVSTDPEWAAAHETLCQAFDSVQQSLDGWAADTGPMPTDITDRLTAALSDAGPLVQPAVPNQPAQAPARHLTAVPGSDERVDDGPRTASRTNRRRWSRLAGPVAVAAAATAFAGFGLSQFGTPNESNSTSDAAGKAPTVSGIPYGAPAQERMFTSGTDYGSATLGQALAALGRQVGGGERGGAESVSPLGSGPPQTEDRPSATSGDRTPSGLARLATSQDALAACLEAIALSHGRAPVTFNVVDLAAYEGVPAVVAAFTDGAGTRWAWVSGSDCGLPTSGPDTRYRVQVG
ncbi:hypothetical protein ACI2K4_19610 [Micromonospora sp. NPDC050397]|uniref:hypothetical protein n=1 Tax=Micromonospora sp. NPDC050397 TaxID=3364279 RepID=UPI00384EA3F2